MFHPRATHRLSPSLTLRPSTDRSPAKFCENGRAYVTDPSTGQPVCLCQLDSHSAHSLQTHPALRGLRAYPVTRPTFGDMHNYQTQLSSLAPISEQANGLVAGHVQFHPYGPMYAGLDVNGGAVRKAATRETTGPLKIWLSEHKKNPYPTKAEKIMLAIITRMTLTQVSTWFANARRRLKKDNRLSPEGGDEDNVGLDSDREGDTDSLSVGAPVDVERDVKTALRTDEPLSSEGEGEPDSFSDISEDENDVFRQESPDNSKATTGPKVTVNSPSSHLNPSETLPSTSEKNNVSSNLPDRTSPDRPKPKPKIWSISHILDS